MVDRRTTLEVTLAPHPGSAAMPRWKIGELVDAPRFTRRNWFALLGPGLLMGGASIGGGEWLLGPVVTAKYGGALMWLATLSIVGQVFYNIEISRYTLYTGEPIFTGKFRTLPGPHVWLTVYLLLDFGSVFPYLASNAATPLAAIYLGRVPGEADSTLQRGLGSAVFLLAMLPMIFGGKIYDTLKKIMTVKVVVVLGYLLMLAVCFSTWDTWREILGGFLQFGSVPIKGGNTGATANVFGMLARGEGLPTVDFSMIATLAGFAAIAGSGGLTNVSISGYTRDSGWGMGYHVGAIPSMVGGKHLALSHVGMVFPVTPEALVRWRGWIKHVVRDQVAVWMPACFLGIALPSMLSIQFLPRGTEAKDWSAAAMTAGGVSQAVREAVGPLLGSAAWYATILCGFLVLGPSVASTADGVIRRWVDVFWTSSPRLQAMAPDRIRYVFFFAVLAYATFGIIALSLGNPMQLVKIATTIMNFALGFSCWHTLAVNNILLPKELRPNYFMRAALLLSGCFFLALATITAAKEVPIFLRSIGA